MHKVLKIPTLARLVFVLCAVAGTTAAGYAFPGGFISTTTSVSVEGTVNDTVSITLTTAHDGLTEKNEWGSSYISETPARQSFGSHLAVGASNGNFWWNFQRIGVTDDTDDTLIPGAPIPFFSKPSFTHFF
ncbi:MAG: hypothetical protein HGA55_05925 [Methanoregulaceae archaeon]|nr:hypothetical protein [Methanoregulaceae archaeon]